MEIPVGVSARGVHLHPNGLHDFWMEDGRRQEVIGKLQEAKISWAVAITESDNFRISGAAQALLEAGIIPIVRPAYKLPAPWSFYEETAQLANLYAQYGVPLIVQFANEPFDPREWKDGNVPPEDEAWAIIRDRWLEMSNLTVMRGAYPGFPDGPCYSRNPFEVIGDDRGFWHDGLAVYLGHYYGKGRPLDYPTDDVSKYGTPLTYSEYMEQLDDFAEDPAWNEGELVLQMMNAQREAWANPNLTAIDDPTCWRGWQLVQHYAQEAFGFPVQMAMTEGGWQPRDRAGSGLSRLYRNDPCGAGTRNLEDVYIADTIKRFMETGPSQKEMVEFAGTLAIDIRWPYTTPKMVAKKVLEMESDRPPEMFALCSWLWADGFMAGGDVGWPYDAWWTWAYSPPYDFYKPVVDALIASQPGGDAESELNAALQGTTDVGSHLTLALADLLGRRQSS